MNRAAVIGWLVHLFTASGAALSLLSLMSAYERDFTTMFLWLSLALFVDGVDGTLARRYRVTETAPQIDGGVLDLIVDFMTYVLAPVVAIIRSGLMPDAMALALGLIVVSASALYFSDRRMKTPDLWFRGFPALWNVVAFYLLVFRPAAAVCMTVLAAGTLAMFLPFAFVHPVRVRQWRRLTTAVLFVWIGAAAIVIVDRLDGGALARGALLASGGYFLALSALRKTPSDLAA